MVQKPGPSYSWYSPTMRGYSIQYRHTIVMYLIGKYSIVYIYTKSIDIIS